MKVSKVLRQAKAVIATPDKWCKDFLEIHGRHCFFGALNMAHHGQHVWTTEAFALGEKIAAMIALPRRAGISDITAVVDFNNAQTTTHEDIMNLFDRAIAIAEQEENPRISDAEYTRQFIESVSTVKTQEVATAK